MNGMHVYVVVTTFLQQILIKGVPDITMRRKNMRRTRRTNMNGNKD